MMPVVPVVMPPVVMTDPASAVMGPDDVAAPRIIVVVVRIVVVSVSVKAGTEMVVMMPGEYKARAAVMKATAVEGVHAAAAKNRGAAMKSASTVKNGTAMKSAAAVETTATATAMEATAAATTVEATATAATVPAVNFGDQRVGSDFRDRRCGRIDW